MPPQDPAQAAWFATHVQPHEAMLRAWLAQGFGPRLAVDDVVQEAFLRVLRARDTGELQSPKAFLFAIARNLAVDQLRRHALSRTDSLVEADLSNVLDDHESIPETVAREQERALLTEAIQSLPERCRQVMTLRMVYSLSQRVIASACSRWPAPRWRRRRRADSIFPRATRLTRSSSPRNRAASRSPSSPRPCAACTPRRCAAPSPRAKRSTASWLAPDSRSFPTRVTARSPCAAAQPRPTPPRNNPLRLPLRPTHYL